MREGLTRLKQNRLVRAATILVGGTALAQAVAVIALPLLTRLYTPEHFSILAVYTGLLMICSTPACLRLDIAIPMPESDSEAANLLALALGFSLVTSLFLVVPILVVPDAVTEFLGIPQLRPFLWMVPLGVFLTAAFGAMQYWCARKKEFSLIARTRIAQSIGGAGTMIGLGFLGISPLGLLLGQMINNGAGLLTLGRRSFSAHRDVFASISLPAMCRVLRAYRRYPKYSTLEALANTAGVQLPVILIASLVAGAEAGFLALAMRAVQGPMALVGGAVAQVYQSRAPEEYRAGSLGTFTASVLGGLLKAGVGPLLCLGMIAPEVFSLLFGEQWRRAGDLVAWMTPWFIIQFLVSPLSIALHITNRHRLALALQVFGLLLRVCCVVLAATVAGSFLAEAYSVSGFVFYAIYLVCVLAVVSPARGELCAEIKYAVLHILAWCVAGGLFVFFVGRLR